MRSRWYHVPRLHTHADGVEKRASWLELFYDLIFVAAFIQLGNGLAEKVSVARVCAFGGLFVPLWIAWSGFTHYANRFTIDDFTHRLLVFAQMFSVGAMAVTVPLVLDGETQMFAITYACAQAVIVILNFRAWRQVPAARPYARYWGTVFSIGAVIWLGSAFVPAPHCYVLWGLGLLVILWAPSSKASRALQLQFPTDQEHLGERYGLLTIIVLGESFVKVLSAVAEYGADWFAVLQASMTLLITCCLWWIYFDDVAGSRLKKQRFSWVLWLYAHLPMQLAVTATGVAIKKAVHFDLDATAPDAYRWLLSGSLALVFFSVGIIDSVTERRVAELSDRTRVNVRYGSALLMLLSAPAGGGMTATWYLAIIAALCVGQVVFDMMMAPLEESEETNEAQNISDAVLARKPGENISLKNRVSIDDAVRKGTPSELRQDLYSWFMQGTWGRFFGTLAFLYIMSNVFFAALYILQPGCIATADPNSFADAFFFSVQTISTIGYGSMSPITTYGDVVVTAEAGVGLLGVALATGLMFSKATQARAGVLFSDVLTLTDRHGVPTLTFRVGNAKGNELVDANIWVTVLKDDISPEGDHMRRILDLELVRSRSPLFILSWTVMHQITEDSPLADVNWDNPTNVYSIVVTMTGHDGTYGQTVYARHVYHIEDVRRGVRFADVISELPDGRIMVDYGKFHDVEPIA